MRKSKAYCRKMTGGEVTGSAPSPPPAAAKKPALTYTIKPVQHYTKVIIEMQYGGFRYPYTPRTWDYTVGVKHVTLQGTLTFTLVQNPDAAWNHYINDNWIFQGSYRTCGLGTFSECLCLLIPRVPPPELASEWDKLNFYGTLHYKPLKSLPEKIDQRKKGQSPIVARVICYNTKKSRKSEEYDGLVCKEWDDSITSTIKFTK